MVEAIYTFSILDEYLFEELALAFELRKIKLKNDGMINLNPSQPSFLFESLRLRFFREAAISCLPFKLILK